MAILSSLFKKKDVQEQPQEFFFTADNRRWGVDIDRFYEKDDNGTMTQVSKIIREVNSQGNMQNDTIRYDLFKTLLMVVLDKKVMNFGCFENELQYDFSFNVAFNTLLKEGIIYEIK